ncbi:pyridine nucleotide-disulfide oxidoreductase [Candidatus Aerophobetes bacterium]|uniref:Pyridine nucleotide-disulfide oxidoreductase n=1 Tax=Aerophobetes bacterium TaxID=2030807 RepID=A0A497E5B5_UNCAE|nr:MAG: pyridine nucleotide-disulfide oxidoreductase [Candidatus Aerophobetes bacterium]
MKKCDVLVIGAGPAGLCCAIEAARAGADVILIDENRRPGGQLFKQIHKFFGSKQHKAGIRGFDIGIELLEEVQRYEVNMLLNTVAYGIFDDKTVEIVKDERITDTIQGKKILLATGAIENPVAFPGWTLPGVMGAGAAQTMINIHRVLPGRRFVILGTGNVGLIIAYQLLQAGADVIALVEAASKIGGYQVHASKIRRAGIPIFTSHTIKEVKGNMQVEEVVIVQLDDSWKPIEGTERTLSADCVCIAAGLHPSIELAQMAGCALGFSSELGGHLPLHNEDMETTVDGIYVAGDIAGVEEASTAMEEGRLAGIDMAQKLGHLSKDKAQDKKEKIRENLFALRSGSFGYLRYKAKLNIIQTMEAIKKNQEKKQWSYK